MKNHPTPLLPTPLLHVTLALVTLLVIAVLPNTAHASPDDKVIVLFVPDTDWPPYLINDPSSSGSGVLVDVLQAASGHLGYTVQLRRLPNLRGWKMMDFGMVDAHAKARKWIKNPQDYYWTDPFLQSEDILLFRKDAPYEHEGPEDLKGLSVATIKGFHYPALEASFQSGDIERISVNSPYTMLELVALGRTQAASVNKTETLWLFKSRPELQGDRFRFAKEPCDVAQYRYVFTKQKDWRPFIKAFNTELAAMKKDGRLQKILDKYR